MKVKRRFIPLAAGVSDNQAMLDKSELRRRIAYSFEISGVAQKVVAEACGISEQAISGWLATGSIGRNNIPILARLTNRRLDYFFDPSIQDDDSEDVGATAEPSSDDFDPILATTQGAALGGGMSPDDYAETHKLKFRAASLRRKGLRPDKLEVYYGRGDSMEPRIRDGDAILVDKADTRIVDDRIYFIRHDGHFFVKRLQKHADLVFIVSDNRDDPQWRKPVMVKHGDDFEVLGRVRWIGSWED